MRFTEITPARVQRLTVGEQLSEHGIHVEKTHNGDEKWSLAFMYMGVRVKRVVGRSSEGFNRTRAEARMDAIKADIREGACDLPKGRKTQLRFKELAAWYVDELGAGGGKNLVRKRFQLRERLIPHFGGLVVVKMTEGDVARYAKALRDSGLSPSTINRDLATLCHVLSTAVRQRKIRNKPCHVPKLAEPAGRTVTLARTDMEALRIAAKADCNPYLWLFVEFGLATGMRSSEIVRARFEDIDWQLRRLFLPEAKAGGRSQPLTKSLVDLLKSEQKNRGNPTGWVFPSRTSKSGHATNFNTPFKRAVNAAKLCPERVTPHVMRHTAATMLVASGAPLPAVQKVTGHKTLIMLSRYVHLADANIDHAISALEHQPS